MNRRDLLTRRVPPLASVLPTGGELKGKGSPARGARAGYFPNYEMTTHEGKKIRFYDDVIHGDKIVVINMMYAQCEGICPPMTANLTRVKKLLGDRVGRDIFLYSITLKPQQDTPQALRHYAQMHKAGPDWVFLTGDPAEIDVLRRKLGFYDVDPKFDKDVSQHIGMLRVGNEAIDRWIGCPALANPEQIAKSILWMQSPKMRSRA